MVDGDVKYYDAVTHRNLGITRKLPMEMKVRRSETLGDSPTSRIERNSCSYAALLMVGTNKVPLKALFFDCVGDFEEQLQLTCSQGEFQLMETLCGHDNFDLDEHAKSQMREVTRAEGSPTKEDMQFDAPRQYIDVAPVTHERPDEEKPCSRTAR